MTATMNILKAAMVPLGRLDWGAVAAEVGDATCVWSDLSGIHVGRLPDERPIATHLWAWRGQTAWRFRVDPEMVIGARLIVGAGDLGVILHAIEARTTPDPGLAATLTGLVAGVRLATTMDAAPVSFLVEVAG